MTRILIGTVGLFAVVAALFACNFRNEFVRLDDFDYVVLNTHIHDGLTPKTVRWAFTDAGYAANWHPLTWISHAADITVARLLGWRWQEDEADEKGCRPARCWGPLAELSHAENVALHAANAALLMLVILMLIKGWAGEVPSRTALLIAGFCALLWAVHPLRVEVVAWASERKELLSVFFMLLSMLAYLRQSRPRCSSHIPHPSSLLSLLFFALALLAKPVAVSLPAVLFGCDVLLGRKGALRRLVPFVLLSVGTCVLTMMAQKEALSQGEVFSVLTRIVCAVEAPVVYLRQTLWPFGLSVSYPMPETWRSVTFALGVVLLGGIAALGGWWLWNFAKERRDRWTDAIPLSLAWCYVALLPMLGIVKVGYQPHSDRYTYWVGCGVAAAAALVAAGLARQWEMYARQLLIGAVCLGAFWGVCSRACSARWSHSRPLFTDAVKSAHLEADAWVLSEILLQCKDMRDKQLALPMLRDVLAIRRSPYARAILAHALAIVGEPDVRVDSVTGKSEAFEEVKMLASGAFDEGSCRRDDAAFAALAFAEYRLRHYARAYDYMKKAYEAGYACNVLDLKLADFERKAKEEEHGLEQK